MTNEKKKKYEDLMGQFQDGIQKAMDDANKEHLKKIKEIQSDEDVVGLTRHSNGLYGLFNIGDFDVLLERGKITEEQKRCFQKKSKEYRVHRYRGDLGTQRFFHTIPLLSIEEYVCYDPSRRFPESSDVYKKVDIQKIDFSKNKIFLECRDPKEPYAKVPTYYRVDSIDDMFSAIEKAICDDVWADNSYYCQCLIYKKA